MRSVIIDTDPGVDDALALMMALNCPDLTVEGITTVGGNASLSETTSNALRLVEHLDTGGRHGFVPIAEGADRPSRGSFTHAYHVHGPKGLGTRLPEPKLEPCGMDAVDFMRERISASPGETAIIAIGPLTNVAMALENRPDIADALSEVIVMGGAVGVPGNVTPHAEFNIYEDPWAANVVFGTGVPVILVGLDVTHLVSLHRRDGPRWFEGASKSARLGNRIMANRFQALDDMDEFHLHDPLAVAAAIKPDILTCRRARVSVVTRGNERGRTVASYGDGTVRVAVGVDAGRATELVRKLIAK